MDSSTDQDYKRFKQEIFQLTGIDLSLYKEEQMRRRLTSLRLRKEIPTFQAYFNRLKEEKPLLKEFLSRMTINVTEFFRNRPRWTVLENKIRSRALTGKPISVWSAACSTGEEPYSLAILLSKYYPKLNFSIVATDLDQIVLDRAMEGAYLGKALEPLTQEERQYFTEKDMLYYVDSRLKQTIQFLHHDLLRDPSPGRFDLIVCRNVLIYFTEDGKKTLYHKLSDALKPQGILFVGSTEQIFNASSYQLRSTDTFFYEKFV
ncbi:CheR family methyltransferase [Sporolactobacillus kofuensis]|uniref:protein-glutamate O-methyltransferase n=1 Tax=Sporolactobacillus kofuensis TaxID=269672 RepID=A0ABW1WEH9_9BACL|nr:protein-glutamate O-methyltransferase CheR [Sporolactobacillus kofuensis]MCO7176751.1 protein-glutamate O-methyltransferase CheR [Sporolactobacillus kofuensis]